MSTAANTTTSATNPTATPSTSRPITVPAGMPVANVVDLNALVAALGQLRGHGTSDRLLQLKEFPTFSGSPARMLMNSCNALNDVVMRMVGKMLKNKSTFIWP